MSESFQKETHKNIDIIKGEPKRAIRKLAAPMILSMFLIMVYNLADSVWVSGLGADALAALGFVTPLFMIVIGLGNGLGAGANSLIARAIGGENKALANNAALHSIVMSIIISIIIPIILIPLLPDIINIMGGGSTMKYALAYGNIIFGLMIVFVISSVFSAVLRSEGDVNRATIAMAITAVLNIVLDPLFIYIFGWGVAGAAWATVVSGLVSCIVMGFWMWVKRDTYMDLHFSEFNASKYVVTDIMKVAIPSTFEQLIISLLVIGINAMLTMTATATMVAVYTAAMRIVQMAMIPLMGFGTALLTVAGAGFGARNYDKMKTSFSYTIKLGLVISIVLAILIVVFAPQLALLFSYSAETAYLTSQIEEVLRILSLFLVFMSFGIAGSCLFQGVGRGTTSLIITIFRSLIGEIVFSYLLGIVFGMGYTGVFYGLILGSFCGCMFGYIWARVYLKELKKVFKNPSES